MLWKGLNTDYAKDVLAETWKSKIASLWNQKKAAMQWLSRKWHSNSLTDAYYKYKENVRMQLIGFIQSLTKVSFRPFLCVCYSVSVLYCRLKFSLFPQTLLWYTYACLYAHTWLLIKKVSTVLDIYMINLIGVFKWTKLPP